MIWPYTIHITWQIRAAGNTPVRGQPYDPANPYKAALESENDAVIRDQQTTQKLMIKKQDENLKILEKGKFLKFLNICMYTLDFVLRRNTSLLQLLSHSITTLLHLLGVDSLHVMAKDIHQELKEQDKLLDSLGESSGLIMWRLFLLYYFALCIALCS